MPEVVVLGDINIDIAVRLESYPPLGGDAQPLTTTLLIGGTSLNTAVVLTRLGVETALVGRVGRDVLGAFAVAEIERNGLSAQWIQHDDEVLTGLAYVAVTPDGQRTMLGGAGANRNLDASALPFDVIQRAQWLHVSSYNLLGDASRAATLAAVDAANANCVTVSLDIGNAPQRLVPDVLTKLVPLVDVVMPSDNPPLSRVVGGTGEGRVGVILHKLGADGCAVITRDGMVRVPSFAVNVVDTTGAGDAFNGGFIAGRVRGLDVRASGLLGNACGAAAVTVNGAGGAFPSHEVVLRLLNEQCPIGWEMKAAHIQIAMAFMQKQIHD